jgi:hypothetical protein
VSALAVLGATAVSLGALGYLAATDPKRRRAFRLPPPAPRRAEIGWTLALLPGVLAAWSGAAGLFAWLGAVTVVGWILAATSPDRAAAARRRLEATASRLRGRVGPLAAATARAVAGAAAWRPERRSDRTALLEQRVAALEAELTALRRALPQRPAGDDNVFELALPAGRR